MESYIPGREFAVEGLVTAGGFQPLAIFDKPDPLEGPFFEETIYVTPSREPADVQEALIETTARAVRALGFRHGPVHAELRYNQEGAWMLEAHARPIGGLCAKALRFDGRHAARRTDPAARAGRRRVAGAPGRAGLGRDDDPDSQGRHLRIGGGLERRAAVAGIEDVIITAKAGQRLVPLPEGASYLGFIFARGDSAAAVERALRRSHAELRFHIATALETFKPSAFLGLRRGGTKSGGRAAPSPKK